MNEHDIIALGVGITPPWRIMGQILDTSKSPHELRIKIKADRGTEYPCPVCDKIARLMTFKRRPGGI